VGREHTNTFYDIARVNFSIQEHYSDTENLSLDQYILFGGLCQGLNLGYSLESLRANDQTMGAIFWMYNDTWGENGWTIIDYYCRRKISFYGVRRALAARKLVLRRGGQAFGGSPDDVLLIALNDRPETCTDTVAFGYLSYDGSVRVLREIKICLPSRGKQVVATCPVPSAAELRGGTIVAIPQTADLEPVSWRHCRYREANVPLAKVRMVEFGPLDGDMMVTVETDNFAHAVHLTVPGFCRVSDQYFDLLPGERRTITVYDGSDLTNSSLAVHCVNQAQR